MITVGVDLGQSRDPTAIVALATYRPELKSEDFDELVERTPLRDRRRGRLVSSRPEHQILHIERVALGTPYPVVVSRLATVADQLSFYGPPTVVLDATGVGRPVVDMCREAMPNRAIHALTITGAMNANQPNAFEIRVPKREIVAAVQVVLQTRRLKVAPDRVLALAADLQGELDAFQFDLSPTGADTYEAASGHHDDLVLALGLALWHAERPGQGSAFIEAFRRRLAPVLP